MPRTRGRSDRCRRARRSPSASPCPRRSGREPRRSSRSSPPRPRRSVGGSPGTPATKLGRMDRITDLLAAGRTFSFEFFPPKNDEEQRLLTRTIADLQPLNPSFVSVTYRGGRVSRERTTRGVAAHPAGHPRSPDLETDRDRLAFKLELADFAITQFFFKLEEYERLREELAARRVTKPILAGIMPITSLTSVQHMAQLSGYAVP